ncbi:MAG: hypothetical protein A2144_05190 [Chloroflexi bacterium RBG_16_50_9]|nr:MAG: hypothetical protein A2144_05190 [Chloroflexi bacterium RBG_16_50_9]
MSNVSVIGAGYVGLVTAAGFAELGHKVKVLEIAPSKLNAMERNVLPINEPGLEELWLRNRAEGRIAVTGDYLDGLSGAQFAFITVGTPSTRNGKPDLKWVRSAARSIAEAARGPLIVVIKSTVPIGTADLVSGLLAHQGRSGYRFPVVSNPEFLREGAAVFDFMNPNRVVVGSSDPMAAEAVAKLYQPLNSPLIECDNRTAEMSKYASNVFLATRISYMNEMALLCDEYDVDIVKVASIMGMDQRFGCGYLNAGLGWGGSCLPKDVRGLLHIGKSRGIHLHLVRAVMRINEKQTSSVVRKALRLLGSLEGKTIGILGLSFKPGSDDMREARSISLISLLEDQGCHIRAYDPVAMEKAAKILPWVTYCDDAYEVARGSDALILVTEWDEFKEIDLKAISSLMHHPILIDGRNIYDPEAMLKAGFIYEGIGRHGVGYKKAESLFSADIVNDVSLLK